MGLQLPRGRPAEIHDRQRAVSEIKIQNGGLETVRRFFVFENEFIFAVYLVLACIFSMSHYHRMNEQSQHSRSITEVERENQRTFSKTNLNLFLSAIVSPRLAQSAPN